MLGLKCYFFQSIFCSNELKWIKIFNSFQSIFVCWHTHARASHDFVLCRRSPPRRFLAIRDKNPWRGHSCRESEWRRASSVTGIFQFQSVCMCDCTVIGSYVCAHARACTLVACCRGGRGEKERERDARIADCYRR